MYSSEEENPEVKTALMDAVLSCRDVLEIFELQARLRPDSIALECGAQVFTYGLIEARANRLAERLIALGAGPERIVGLLVEQSLEMVVGMLGIMKSGSAYLPLDPAYPMDRLSYMIADARIIAIVTRKVYRRRASKVPIPTLCMESIDWDAKVPLVDRIQIHPSQAAYLIYTSGSTGKPKGVLVQHDSLHSLIHTAVQFGGNSPSDRILQFASPSFDASVSEIFTGLAYGATLVVRTPEMLSSLSGFVSYCEARRLTVLGMPTAFWHQLVQIGSTEEFERLAGSVKIFGIGGESANPGVLVAWREKTARRIALVNVYGPTETTVIATMWRDRTANEVDRNGDDGERTLPSVPIGQPLHGIRCRLYAPNFKEVEGEEEGEIYIEGVCVSRGYRGNPGLTASKFIPAAQGMRSYRSGDLGRMLPDKQLLSLGRVDQQVKISGYRIELGEIEAALARSPEVQNAAVCVVSDEANVKRLFAFVVFNETIWDDSGLRAYLAESLPEYMVPSVIVALPELPLSPNGKVDRQALSEMVRQPEQVVATLQPIDVKEQPKDALQSVLLEIWREVFKNGGIGLNDDFQRLGGNSLMAMRILSSVKAMLAVELPLEIFLKPLTVTTMLEAIEDAVVMDGR